MPNPRSQKKVTQPDEVPTVKVKMSPELWAALNRWGLSKHGRLWTRLPFTEKVILAVETGIDFQPVQ